MSGGGGESALPILRGIVNCKWGHLAQAGWGEGQASDLLRPEPGNLPRQLHQAEKSQVTNQTHPRQIPGKLQARQIEMWT